MTAKTAAPDAADKHLETVGALPALSDVQVEAVGRELEEPGWLIDIRRAALNDYRRQPMPSSREEIWRHNPLLQFPFAELPLEVLALSGKPKKAPTPWLKPVAGGGTGGQIVLEDKVARIVNLNPEWSQAGVVFLPIAQAAQDHPDLLREWMGKIVPASGGKFAALASVVFDAGVILYVPPGVRVAQPLQASIWSSPDGLRAERLLVVLAEGAQASLLFECASPEKDAPAGRFSIAEVSVGRGASLQLFTSQAWGKNVSGVATERATVAGEGHLDWGFAQLGGGSCLTTAGVDLLEPGAQVRWAGLSALAGSQQNRLATWQNHHSKDTTSDFLFKGVVTDEARSVWRGMVRVDAGAAGADGYQAGRMLLLSDRAKVESVPGLEILADDVHCSHGVSIGDLDPEELFYLQTRGLSLADSRRLLIDGFFDPVLEKFPQEDVRKRIRGTLEEKLESLRGEPEPIQTNPPESGGQGDS